MQESNIITLSPGLLQQFNRLRIMGRYIDEQSLLRASFEALERELNHRGEPGYGQTQANRPYMSHPGLSPDDYDT
jgi:hypothetical protein